MTENTIGEPQPDLRQAVADALHRQVDAMAQMPPEQRPPAEHQLSKIPTPEQITIRGQRTWRNVPMLSPRLNGADFSSAVAQLEQNGYPWSYFVQATRLPDRDEWAIAHFSGGRAEGRHDAHRGLLVGGGSHVCVGGLNVVPDGGKIRVTLADGSVYEDTASNGSCVVFAPLTSPPGPDDHATVQLLNPDGSNVATQHVHVGDGRPPRRE